MGVLLGVLLGLSLAGLAVLGLVLLRERAAAQRAQAEARQLLERVQGEARQYVETAQSEARRQAETAQAEARLQVEGALTEARQQAERAHALEQLVTALKRFEPLVDVEAAAGRMRDEATAQARAITHGAQQSAAGLVAQAQAEATRLAEEAQTRMTQLRARTIEAENGLAATAAESKRLAQTAEAMRNVVEGYGDRYVLPTSGLLDELAEEFSFTDAGQKLKEAREHTRQLVYNDRAADCGYAEAVRRTTAIAFVLDAFNGKVDTVLSSVRHDNYGTLRKKIEDALELVNFNG